MMIFVAIIMYMIGLAQGWAWAKGYDNWIRNWVDIKRREIWTKKNRF